MTTFTRLTQVYRKSMNIPFDDKSKIVFFSDVHRGDNSKADNFAFNKDIYMAALNYYYDNGFTYIEIGDGDELWENDRFSTILKAHSDVFNLINRFHNSNRLYMIWGNHDMVKKYSTFAFRYLRKKAHSHGSQEQTLFAGLKVHEGIVLNHRKTNNKIFVVHGHQGDLLNDHFWPLARFLVKYILRQFEMFKNKNPISPAANSSRAIIAESGMKRWAQYHKTPLIAGHTHKVSFPWPGETPYFNDGCCVKDGSITGIEISEGKITLVRWARELEERRRPHEFATGGTAGKTCIAAKEDSISGRGRLRAIRHVIAGPEKIQNYY